ncbi:DUF1542 domain-containing protein, partial [Streptococcus mitis]|uniref:DUF1542 domain-containing protein n=2 Tax=Streptococcus mitis TaxID=28037 RepID=UPI0019339319
MGNKPSMSRVERLHREKVTRYSIRKYSFGAASVAVAALFMFLGNGAVSVQADQIQPGDTAAAQPATPALDKTQLESYISEIETKLSNGSYDNKTEESVAVLKTDLEAAKATLANATTQAELKTAYSKLVTTANSKLKNKPVEKKETPAVDTTEGKETVGKSAENTEKKPDSNSIENTGSNDARNGKELDKNNAFRSETDTEKPKVSIDYDDPASQTFWVTPTEETNITGRIKITDNSGKIVKGWMQKMGSGTETDIGYGLHNSNIDAETPATTDQPATLSVTGKLQDRHPNGKPWSNGSTVVSRKVRAKDASNNQLDNEGASDPDAQVWFKIRSQNVKYKEDLANKAANFDKVAVADPAQLQQPELDKIKAELQAGDGNNLNGKIDTVTQKGDKVVITYNDGTTAERPVTDFARVNVAPTLDIPYSNKEEKQIYLYTTEESDISLKVKDDSGKVKEAVLKFPGGQNESYMDGGNKAAMYLKQEGMTTSEVTASEDAPHEIKLTGAIPKGTWGLNSNTGMTRILYAKDTDDKDTTASFDNDKTVNGYIRFILKDQTVKYDIKTLDTENKIAVNDANDLTDADLEKIKNNLKVEYAQTNDDARLADKKGKEVEDASTVVDKVEKDGNNLVVTYKDGSKDIKPISDVVRTNKAPEVTIPYSVDGKKDVYVYANEDFDIPIKFTDDLGKIASATVKRGGNQNSPAKDPSNPDVLDNEFGMTLEAISTETPATAENPAIVHIKGNLTKETQGLAANKFPTDENGEYPIVTRYATATDTDGAFIENTATSKSYANDPGSFAIKLKAQTAKYDIKVPETKVPVVDANNVTDAEFNEIKKNIKIQYSTENPDKNLADKKGKDVDDQNNRVESIEKVGNEVVVTYKDGSIDKKPLTDFARTNPAPTVELPYSNADKRQIYVYTGENTDLTFKASDDAALKKVYLRGPGNKDFDNTAGYGFTTGKINDGALESGEGTVASDKQNATIKMTGVTNLKAGQKWTSIIVAQDEDDARSINNFNSTEDFAERQQRPGYVEFVVKDQTSKYDIKAPTEKVAVTDPANVTEAELAKIKEKLQLEHNKNNDDANISKDAPVTDKDAKIDSVTKDDQGNLVVTYKDGSKDTRPLSEFVTLDKQPAIDEVNKAAEKQIAAINSTPNATDEEKAAAIAKVNADKQKALDEIAKPEVTTKDALDKAQTAGTGAIAKDNPVVSAKPEAKKAIDEAVKAKEAALDARTDLTDDEKKAAKDAAKAAADKAKAAVDNATTNAAVDKAKADGTTAVANVTPVAKAEAKKAINDALTAKNKEIDARPDLTDEEKTAAKNEAKDKADAQLAKINEQPDAATTPTAAKTAQDAVDAAKKTGVDEVTAVNPVAVKKPAAKKAIDDALKAKEDAIDARPDLTDDEKKAAKDAAKAAADKAKAAVDAATTDAAVDAAKGTGTGDIAKVNPVAKEVAKKAVADELAKKEAAIDARPDLTDEEKDAAKKDAQAKAKAATDAINAQPSNAETPEAAKTAQDAVDAAKKTGVDEVTAVNPVAVKKPAAKKAIDDALKAKEDAIDARPDLTDDEKKAAKDAAKAAADKAKAAVDAATTDAAVDAAKGTGTGDIAKVNPVAKEVAKKAVADELAKKEAAIDARPDLTDEEKDAAKKDAQAKAKAATDAINTQPSIAETPEKAAEAQKAVDAAKKTGVDEVAAVNPEAVKKPAAKKAIDDALKAKEAAI